MMQDCFLKLYRLVATSFLLAVLTILLVGLPDFAVADENHEEASENVIQDVAENLPVYSNNPVVAIVEGQSIHLNDLRDAQIHELMMQVFQLQRRKLVEKSMKILEEKHPELSLSGVGKVSDDDIAKFYRNTAEVKAMGTLAQMRSNIRQYLKGLNREIYLKQVAEKYSGAVTQGHVQDFFLSPTDFKMVVRLGTAMRWFPNDTDARRKVFLLEYSDFQCPFCKRVQPTLAKLRNKYSNTVQFGYRHFPLPFHKEATRLAEAVECARDQDRFWEFQGLVYQNTEVAHDPEGISRLAQQAGVKNIKKFEDCWSAGKYRKRVQEDVQAGAKIGIRGTPTFIIGRYDSGQGTITGEMFSGAVPENKFVSVIEKYLTQ